MGVNRSNLSTIHIEACQVKSLEKAKLLCKLLDTFEKEFGIHETNISFQDNFICPDIDLTELSNSKDPMERLVGGLLIKINVMQYGNKSPYKKVKSNDKRKSSRSQRK